MTLARLIFAVMICFSLSFPINIAQAVDSSEKVFEPMRLDLEKDDKIKKLTAEVKRLNQELRDLRATLEGKVGALEAENQSLRQTLESVRN